MVDSKENDKFDLEVKGLKSSSLILSPQNFFFVLAVCSRQIHSLRKLIFVSSYKNHSDKLSHLTIYN